MNPKASFGKLGGLRHAFGSSRILVVVAMKRIRNKWHIDRWVAEEWEKQPKEKRTLAWSSQIILHLLGSKNKKNVKESFEKSKTRTQSIEKAKQRLVICYSLRFDLDASWEKKPYTYGLPTATQKYRVNDYDCTTIWISIEIN